MAGNNNRSVHPRFLVFCASVFIFLIAVVLLVVAVKYGSSMCSTGTRCGGTPDALAIGSTVIDTGEGTPEQNPVASDVNQTDAAVIPDPPALSDSKTYTVQAVEEANPANFGFTYEIRKNNREETYTENPDENALSFGSAKNYTNVKGITTFAGNHYRTGFSYGTATVTMQTMDQVWSYAIGSANGFAGASWTGQPLIVTWEQPTLKFLGVKQEYKDRDSLNEVILCSADGNIYFIELETGSRTRENIAINAPLFGTPTLDPSGAPMLYIGRGTKEEDNKSANYAVNLITNTYQTIVSGKDHTARRSDWAAFDSSPLMIDDMLIWPGESGVLYLVRMNTNYNEETGELSVESGDRIKYRYNGTGYSSTQFAGKRTFGFESSAAAFRNYLYLTDNGGRLQCVDLNTLKLQFVADVGGDSDATPVLEEDGNADTAYIYTCSQTDAQDETLPNGYGYCYVRKFDALTGALIWEQRQICITIGGAKGGSKATPHIGHGTIGDLLICAFYGLAVDTTDADGNVTYSYGGKIVAYDRSTGAVRWEIKQTGNADYVSSPLVVYNARGDAYLIACDRDGAIKLYNAARPGENALFALDLGERIDATPVAFGNYVVVATTGTTEQTRLFCFKLN